MSIQGATTPVAFRPLYLRWLIVVLIVLVSLLVLVKVIPGSDTLVWLAILGLSLALAIP